MELNNNKVSHICLVGDDPTANLTPLIDKDIPCDRLIIVHTIDQKDQYDNLYRVAKSRGAKVDSWLLPQTIDTESIKLSFMQLFERESKGAEKDLRHIWLNSSNGTRQQVLSAYEVARSFQCPIFIVEAEYDSLCWLYPEEWPLTPIKDKLKLHEFFEVNGVILTSQKNKQGIDKKLRELGDRWLEKSSKLHSGLAKLNYLASTSKGVKFTSRQDSAMLKDDSLQWLLDDLNQIDLIEIEGSNVSFVDNDVKFFCNGGWLEEVVFGMVRGLRAELKTIQDDGHSLEVERKINGKLVKNELDVVTLVNNKLHIIECKTKRFDNGEGSDTLYKLDSLANVLGGIKATAALVTFFPITAAEKRRASELDIEIFDPSKLPRLRECLKDWLS
ncbi:MAG: hypothetical protein COB38_01780 [Gammaproteobacteria bacterium]|nr:MAG: hypothetical protein COB38_01780 [Gammaproteobacteria bacterium]